MRSRPLLVVGSLVVLLAILAAAFVVSFRHPMDPQPASGRTLLVVGAENEYASVLSQLGGRYVRAVGIMSNPNTDPHTFEASTVDASQVAGAAIIVQNGLGYDGFMQSLEAASPNPRRIVLTVADIVGAKSTTANPHLWYRPGTMRAVAGRIAQALIRLDPAHKTYFLQRLTAFDRSLKPWQQALRQLKAAANGTRVAVVEPVADYLLQAAGLDIATPWTFQAAIMNGEDPSPQDVATVEGLLRQRRVAVLVYNFQAVEPTTEALLSLAKQHGVPVVGVYETMPRGFDYQSWMLAETRALRQAIVQHKSEVLVP